MIGFLRLPVNVAHALCERTNRPWAYEMKIIDPDDNVLWLGTGPREDISITE